VPMEVRLTGAEPVAEQRLIGDSTALTEPQPAESAATESGTVPGRIPGQFGKQHGDDRAPALTGALRVAALSEIPQHYEPAATD
jgi:hypothetical protein